MGKILELLGVNKYMLNLLVEEKSLKADIRPFLVLQVQILVPGDGKVPGRIILRSQTSLSAVSFRVCPPGDLRLILLFQG